MTISAADLKPLKTRAQKAIQAYQHDLGIGIGPEEDARRQAAPPKHRGQKPLYHEHFGQYFFWLVTGRGNSEMEGSAEEYYGPTQCHQYFGTITRWITKLLCTDKEELSFNQYAYLEDLLQQQVEQYGDDSPNFRELVEWLQEQADKADTYASLFSPLRYNVRTLLEAGERDLSGPLNLARPLEFDEPNRLEYYQRIEKKRVELGEAHLILCEQLQASSRKATEVEFQRLSQLEKQLGFLALDQLDQLDFNRLHARANRQQSADEFKEGLSARLLQPSASGIDQVLLWPGSFQPAASEPGVFPPRIIFTLSELIREFDSNLALCSTPSSRADYATAQLDLFDANRRHIVQYFDPWLEMDTTKVTALNDVLSSLRDLYEQHQHQQLQLFRPMASSPPIARFTPLLLKKKKLSELLIPPFALSDLTKLLQHLEVVDLEGKCITNELKGSAQGKKGRFTAAYRVLHREELMGATQSDSVWVDAFKEEYGAKLEEKAIGHQLKPNGHPAAGYSAQFGKGVELTRAWVKTWRESQQNESSAS